MHPVPFEVVPSAVNTLSSGFLQVLKAAGEFFFRNACKLHRRSRLNSLDIHLPKSFRRTWLQVELLICRATANMRTVTVQPFLTVVYDANHVVSVP